MQDKRIKIIEVVSAALSIYNDSVTEQSARIWINALERFDVDDIQRAFSLYVQTSDNGHFSPKPADIIRTISGTNTDRAKEAWSKVERAVKTYGHYRTVIFSDPIIHRVIYDLGGWVKICMINDEKELHFLGIDFEKRYSGYMNRGKIPVFPNRLVGQEEYSRREYGLDWRDSLEIVGDLEDCKKVFNLGVKPDEVLALDGKKDIQSIAVDVVKRIGG